MYLPPQDIQNGLITIEINEAKLGNVTTLSADDARLNPQVVVKMLEKAQKKGEALNSKSLEHVLLLINDMPGFNAQATLSPGDQTGETDVVLSLVDKPIFDAKIWADNYGSKLIGKARLNGQINFNNLTGYGDQLVVDALTSRGLQFVQGAYSFPVGYSGTRINIGGAVSNYQVKGGGLSNLNANGESYSYKVLLNILLYVVAIPICRYIAV